MRQAVSYGCGCCSDGDDGDGGFGSIGGINNDIYMYVCIMCVGGRGCGFVCYS